MAVGGLIKDSWGIYLGRKVVKGVSRSPRSVAPASEEAALSRELRAWWFRALGLSLLARVIRKAARAWWAAARADLQRRAEARRAAE